MGYPFPAGNRNDNDRVLPLGATNLSLTLDPLVRYDVQGKIHISPPDEKAPGVQRGDIFAVLGLVKASVRQVDITQCMELAEQFGSEGA